jgi:hypothetical protein
VVVGNSVPDACLLDEWKRLIDHAIATEQGDRDEPSSVNLASHPALLPKLIDTYTPPNLAPHQISGYASVDYGEILIRLKIVLSPELDSENNPRYWLSRRIVERDSRAEHRNLYLPPHLQQRGVASCLWRQALALYEALGIRAVWVESERVGRYANVRSGILFKDESEREKVVNAVTSFAARLGRSVSQDIEHPWDVLALAGTISRQAVEDAGMKLDPEARFSDEDQIPLGKGALLSSLCPSWVGRIDLCADSDGYRRLRAYAGLPPL